MITTTTEEKKLEYVKWLKTNYPEMKVQCVKKYVEPLYRWPQEKAIKDLSPVEELEVNLVKTLPHQVIFDIEEQIALPGIRDKLNKRGWSYQVWWTGSRGYHILVEFENLKDLPQELRNRVRKNLIKDIGTDEAVSSEAHFISMWYAPHFKSGHEKYLFDTYTPDVPCNIISQTVIDYCKNELEREKFEAEQVHTKVDDTPNYATDPYLDWAMRATIISGERNNVLFKNLAIMLVHNGLPQNKIEEMAGIIAKNCPGKSPNEFMGWVDKVRRGELNEYNKAEMTAWAMKYNHPVYYNLIVDVGDVNSLMTMRQIWELLWNHRIACQDTWKDMCFYNMFSTALQEKDDDLRCHIMFSSESGTGKDEGLSLVFDILKKLDLDVYKPASITDKTLIGGVNQEQIALNTKHGVSEEEKDNGKKQWKDPREMGILASAHWIGFAEAESILKPGIHNKQVQLIMRQAMDRQRTIQKGVSNLMIDLYTNTTFALSTYPLNDVVMKIVNNGLFQRMLFYHKNMTKEEHDKIMEHINTMKYDVLVKKNFDESKFVAMIAERIRQSVMWYRENKLNITFSKDVPKHILFKWKSFENEYNFMSPSDQSIMNSIIRRASGNLYKIAVLNAISKRKQTVTCEDIDEVYGFVTSCVKSVRDLLLNVDKNKKKLSAILMILSEKPVTVNNMQRIMEEDLKVKSSATKASLIQKLVDLEYIIRTYNGMYEVLAITDKGRKELEEE
jgi:hypothetical protein